MARASTPTSPSWRATRSAARLVLTNTRQRLPERLMAAATRGLSISWTSRKRWAISSTVWVGEPTSWNTGSCW